MLALYFLLLTVAGPNSLGYPSTTVGDILSYRRRRFVVEVGGFAVGWLLLLKEMDVKKKRENEEEGGWVS